MNNELKDDLLPSAGIAAMKCYKHPGIELYNDDCLNVLNKIKDSSINCVLTDPPYLYLKNQKLERDFDEALFFSECKRILKPKGFLVLFGRGTSFYRWNTIISELGIEFKEEIIWNKRMNTLPGIPLQRFHETISIHSLGGSIIKSKVPYLEKKQFDLKALQNDVKRISSAIGGKELEDLQRFVEKGELIYSPKVYNNFFKNGHGERSRAAATLKSMKDGMCEGSIIEVLREHYKTIHPTQKPIRLLERILSLVSLTDDIVFDGFSGSGSTAVACYNMKRKFVGAEIDEEYFNASVERIKKETSSPELFR